MTLEMTQFFVVLNAEVEAKLIGPYSTKDAAVDRGIQEVKRLDRYSTDEEIEFGLLNNGRNDVSIGRLSPANTVA